MQPEFLTNPLLEKRGNEVNPSLVPCRTLYTGDRMPAIGLGTFDSDAVIGAAAVGYRHFDCASVYDNEPLIGRSHQTIMEPGVDREDHLKYCTSA